MPIIISIITIFPAIAMLSAPTSGPGDRIVPGIVASMPVAAAAKTPRGRYSVTVSIGKPKPAVALPKISGDDPSLPLVVIDAGHGGSDPGASRKDVIEKELTLAIARAVRDELLASGRVRVAMTRDDDSFLVLEERYGIARRLKADLFLSFHADAVESPDASGATIYTLSETGSDREAARLVARENRSNTINGVDLGKGNSDIDAILIDLSQRETMRASAHFARLLVREARDDFDFRSTPHRRGGLIVLKAPDVPSALIETGFLSNADDASFLSSREGRRRIARGIREAVVVHFARANAER